MLMEGSAECSRIKAEWVALVPAAIEASFAHPLP
jgi:hypothetical protein